MPWCGAYVTKTVLHLMDNRKQRERKCMRTRYNLQNSHTSSSWSLLSRVSRNFQNSVISWETKPSAHEPVGNTWYINHYTDAGPSKIRVLVDPGSGGSPFLVCIFLFSHGSERKLLSLVCPLVHVAVCVQAEGCHQVSSSAIFHLSFWDTFLPEPGAQWFRWINWPSSPTGPPVSASPMLRWQVCPPPQLFHINAEDSNSDPDDCTASTLPTKQSPPQLLVTKLIGEGSTQMA